MRKTHLLAVFAGLAAVAIFTADASAFYHPTMGRFMQRDPGAGGAMRIGAAGPAVGRGFIPRDSTGTNQYADGMNLHQYVQSNPPTFTDPQGLNRIVVSGGVADCPKLDGDHDQNWKNFVTAAELRMGEDKNLLREGEEIEWFVFRPAYEDRAEKDGKDKNAYTKEIEAISVRQGAKLRWFTSKAQFITLFNTTPEGLKRGLKRVQAGMEWEKGVAVRLDAVGKIISVRSYKRRIPVYEEQKAPLTLISSAYIYSHGVASTITFDLFTSNKVSFGIGDISNLDKSAWEPKAECVSWACNTATPIQDGSTFTGEWKRHLGIPMKGVIGRTDYGPTAGGSIMRQAAGAFKLTAFTIFDLFLMGLPGAFYGEEAFPMLEETCPVPPKPPVLSPGAKWSTE